MISDEVMAGWGRTGKMFAFENFDVKPDIVTFAKGVACVNYYKEANILENVNAVGKVLGEKLEEMKEKHACIGDVRYIGLFSCVELVYDKESKKPLVEYGKDPEGKMGKIIGKLKEKGFSACT